MTFLKIQIVFNLAKTFVTQYFGIIYDSMLLMPFTGTSAYIILILYGCNQNTCSTETSLHSNYVIYLFVSRIITICTVSVIECQLIANVNLPL